MSKKAIDLLDLLSRIEKQNIRRDEPMMKFIDGTQNEFFAFQDSGLNLLIGHEGNGKTKFLNAAIVRLLSLAKDQNSKYASHKLLYVDTERPESQYAFSVKYIFDNCRLERSEVLDKLCLLAVSDLGPGEIKESISTHLNADSASKYIIIIDHVLPLVADMNNVAEASALDHFLKKILFQGHIFIVTIHKPANGMTKALGHAGSSLQRLSSFTLDICNTDEGDGFKLKIVKSRISAITTKELILKKDDRGDIDLAILPSIIEKGKSVPKKENEKQLAKEILTEFISSGSNSKKQLLELIKLKMGYTEGSSSAHGFYKRNYETLISFVGGEVVLTDEGKSFLDE
jgi:hypothetical protein